MTEEQKQHIQWNLTYAHRALQAMADGHHPDAQTLADRRMYADWQLCRLLHKIAPTLPKHLREQVEACFALREQIWSVEYQASYYQAKQKTSPSSLQASDSL